MGMRSRASVMVAAAVAMLAAFATQAGAAAPSHGDVVHIFKPHLNPNQSQNWFGYNQGTLEQNGKLFSSITSNWTVPRASSHKRGEAEYSSTWIGIGGGCPDASCLTFDPTLIQTGTEQDVDQSGHASYSAWWELIPAPSITIPNITPAPGDRMYASITESPPGSEIWTITLQDVTRHQSFTQTVPYSSTHATAEWIDETPVVLDGSGNVFSALPNLTTTPFDHATTNGAPANLKPSEEMQLVDSNGNVIGAPSAPDSDRDGFNDCAWAKTCGVPRS
jgi:hypothetical protein